MTYNRVSNNAILQTTALRSVGNSSSIKRKKLLTLPRLTDEQWVYISILVPHYYWTVTSCRKNPYNAQVVTRIEIRRFNWQFVRSDHQKINVIDFYLYVWLLFNCNKIKPWPECSHCIWLIWYYEINFASGEEISSLISFDYKIGLQYSDAAYQAISGIPWSPTDFPRTFFNYHIYVTQGIEINV